MNNTRTFITKTVASVSLGLALVGGINGTAGAQTREHILLARQVGVPTLQDEDTAARVVVRWEKVSVPFS